MHCTCGNPSTLFFYFTFFFLKITKIKGGGGSVQGGRGGRLTWDRVCASVIIKLSMGEVFFFFLFLVSYTN